MTADQPPPRAASSTGEVTAPQERLRCPVHGIPDCSPLLNGCPLVTALSNFGRALVDGAIEGVADTYTQEGVAIWWENWQRQDADGRGRWLERAHGFGGMVAT